MDGAKKAFRRYGLFCKLVKRQRSFHRSSYFTVAFTKNKDILREWVEWFSIHTIFGLYFMSSSWAVCWAKKKKHNNWCTFVPNSITCRLCNAYTPIIFSVYAERMFSPTLYMRMSIWSRLELRIEVSASCTIQTRTFLKYSKQILMGARLWVMMAKTPQAFKCLLIRFTYITK